MSPARDFVLFTDYSPYPPYREPVRGPAAADDDFSVTLAAGAGGPLRIRPRFERLENGPIVNDALLGLPVGTELPMIEEICRGNRAE